MKRLKGMEAELAEMSPPARGRGLKHARAATLAEDVTVAPRTGAWIETSCLD